MPKPSLQPARPSRLPAAVRAALVVVVLAAATLVAAPAGAQPVVAEVRLVSLGDSYISGNGARAYAGPAGCYRSNRSFGQRWVELQGARGVPATHTNAACSGARTRDVDRQIQGAASELRSATHVMISIGGNDAGFGDLVFQCLVTRDRRDCEDAVEDAIDLLPELRARLRANLDAIAVAAPDATIAVIGYPLLVGANSYRLPGYEAGNAIRTLGALAAGAYLAEVRAANAGDPGRFVYVDLHGVYAGHELAGPRADWIRQIGTSVLRAEWVHPTAVGHRATAVHLDALDGFAGSRLRLAPGDVVVDADAGIGVAIGDDGALRRIVAGQLDCVVAGATTTVHTRSAVAIASLPTVPAEVATCAGRRAARTGPDLDGDGRVDLAVGAPGESTGTVEGAGAVTVLPAPLAPAGPAPGGVVLSQDTAGLDGEPETGDGWGQTVVVADVDGDGTDDLVVGAPAEDDGAIVDAGSITVLIGGPRGPGSGGIFVIDQSTAGIAERSEPGDRFGASLAAGDLDGDGYDDIVVGVPGEGLNGRGDVGAVVVVPGSATGPVPGQAMVFDQNKPDIAGSNETGDQWGAAVAVGDLNGDGFDDVAVGAPGEGIGSSRAAGAVTVLWGSSGGPRGATTVHQGTEGVPGVNQSGDRFGATLAVGDLDGDGIDDLAVAAPGKSLGGRADVGSVTVFTGSTRGLRGDAAVLWHQGTPGVPGVNESGDRWGSALAIGDLTGDGIAELVVGAPDESIGERLAVGAVTVLLGTPTGPRVEGATLWHQGTPGVPGVNEPGDRWGASLAVADLDGDGIGDLAIGAPGESIGRVTGAGSITVLRGSSSGVLTAGSRLLHQGSAGVPGDNEPGDTWAVPAHW